MLIVLVVLITVAAARILVGVLDLAPRRRVTGTVLSMRDRKFADFLPHIAQQLIFRRNANAIDRRKVRREVVLSTESGERQWTIRKLATQRQLAVGSHVTLTVTPLAGHVAAVEVLVGNAGLQQPIQQFPAAQAAQNAQEQP